MWTSHPFASQSAPHAHLGSTVLKHSVPLTPGCMRVLCSHQQARAIIDAHLPDTGALLLRNLPVTNPEACESFVRGLDYQHMAYEPMGAPRKKVCHCASLPCFC